jgi:citrate lyase subunit beta-like protein
MIEKSLDSRADSVCYDLEDSVTPGKKANARRLVSELLNVGWVQQAEIHSMYGVVRRGAPWYGVVRRGVDSAVRLDACGS